MISKNDFAAVIAFIEAGCRKKLEPREMDVYFGMLADLPLPVLQIAAQRALLETE